MKKYKSNILLLSLVSLLLSSCGNTNTMVAENPVTVESEINQDDTNLSVEENKEDDKKTTAEKIFGFTDYSKYDYYDDSMLIGINIKDISDESEKQLVFIRSFNAVFDKEEYGEAETFLADAKESSFGYLTDEELETANVLITLTRYDSIDGKSSYHEKRVVYEIPREGEENELVISLERTVIDAISNSTTMVGSISSTRGVGNSFGVVVVGDESYEIPNESAREFITEFNIPTGVYTKDELSKLVGEKKGLSR